MECYKTGAQVQLQVVFLLRATHQGDDRLVAGLVAGPEVEELRAGESHDVGHGDLR